MTAHEDCQHWLSSLSEYVDGDLGPQLCEEIERHMADCENCRIVIDSLRKTISLYHATAPKPEAPADVRERLFRRLNIEDILG
jgi:anti-sigma factor (TIGR02949 family)